MERYYFGTTGQEPDIDCTERCPILDNGVMIGSVKCQECPNCVENDRNEYDDVSWIKCCKMPFNRNKNSAEQS